MEEREFNLYADATLARIEQALEKCGDEVDFEIGAGGVIEIEFEHGGGSKIIINRIVRLAKSGSRRNPAVTISKWTRPIPTLAGHARRRRLARVLSRCISEQAGVTIIL